MLPISPRHSLASVIPASKSHQPQLGIDTDGLAKARQAMIHLAAGRDVPQDLQAELDTFVSDGDNVNTPQTATLIVDAKGTTKEVEVKKPD